MHTGLHTHMHECTSTVGSICRLRNTRHVGIFSASTRRSGCCSKAVPHSPSPRIASGSHNPSVCPRLRPTSSQVLSRPHGKRTYLYRIMATGCPCASCRRPFSARNVTVAALRAVVPGPSASRPSTPSAGIATVYASTAEAAGVSIRQRAAGGTAAAPLPWSAGAAACSPAAAGGLAGISGARAAPPDTGACATRARLDAGPASAAAPARPAAGTLCGAPDAVLILVVAASAAARAKPDATAGLRRLAARLADPRERQSHWAARGLPARQPVRAALAPGRAADAHVPALRSQHTYCQATYGELCTRP
eukprot:355670-Chlamydomonas_euryale.AAC.3